MLRRLLLIAVPLILLAARGPALLAAGAEDLGALALIPALKGLAEGPGLPACGTGGEDGVSPRNVAVAGRWLSVGDGLGAAGDAEGLLRRGWAAWVRGDCAEAEALWQEACAGEVSDQVAMSCLRLYVETEGALGGVVRSGGSGERMAGYAHDLGLRAERDEAEGRAAFAYELSLSLDPSREAADRLACLYRRDDRDGDALAVWEALAEALPGTDPDHWWARGEAAELEERWAEAPEAYGRGAELAKDPYQSWLAQGDAYRRAQAFGLAEGSYRRAIAVRPDTAAPYERLGHVRRSREDFAGARDVYREAARIDPDRVAPWYYIGLSYYQEERLSQAKAAFEEALTVDPEHAGSHYYLARCLQQEGELEQSVEVLARAIRLHNGEPSRWARQLGDWRRDLGDRDGALEAYEQALEWRPGEESIEERIRDLAGER